MRRSLVVAMARNRVIGRDNALPWRLPADLAHLRPQLDAIFAQFKDA